MGGRPDREYYIHKGIIVSGKQTQKGTAMISKKNRPRYIRIGTFGITEILPYVGHLSKKLQGVINGETKEVSVSMTSQRYEVFKKKGIKCVSCGIKGEYFALERSHGTANNPNKYHLNLYAKNKHGAEILLTKDHIFPVSKGGKNEMSNYQTMCEKCNSRKGNKVICSE